jgi:hypothetical protein
MHCIRSSISARGRAHNPITAIRPGHVAQRQRCRQVAEAIRADQQYLRNATKRQLLTDGLTSPQLTDQMFAAMSFDDENIVADERRVYGDDKAISRISPDEHVRYIVNGWSWTW